MIEANEEMGRGAVKYGGHSAIGWRGEGGRTEAGSYPRQSTDEVFRGGESARVAVG